jgi:RNA polymerase sigma-70 factor (ECF subfamily)
MSVSGRLPVVSDETLIRRILRRQGSLQAKAAADVLVERYYDEIYRYAYRQSLDSADPGNAALDITQEIFISALRSLSSFDPGKAGFRTWLYRVAISRIIDHKRRPHQNEVQIDATEIISESDF